MPPTEHSALCVSVHDAAPATWPECLRLLNAIRAVADVPLTWLLVPRYHGSYQRSREMEAMLDTLLSQGHELVLHGYTHLDTAPLRGGIGKRWQRTVYTRGEGEFAGVGADEARLRIELGLEWFRRRGWPVSGFVAPAWLLSNEAWRVLHEFPFEYTTTMGHFHLLHPRRSLFSPSLVYTARNASGRRLSPRVNDALATLLAPRPLVRLSLHPRDAHYPELLLHAQHLLERLLASREALTKAAFAQRLTSTVPSGRRRASVKSPSPRSTTDTSHSARPHP